jgi:HEPN domain-containing protein
MSHAAWFEQAESDLRAARILSDANLHSQAIWLASQAVEKGHKAILAALGLRYEDKHFKHLGHGTGEIAKLLPEALQEPIDTNVARMVASLETRAAASRYPAPVKVAGNSSPQVLAPASSISASQQDVEDAAKLLDWCRSRMVRATSAVQAMKP